MRELRQFVKVRHRTTKEALPVYYIELETSSNNKEVFNLRYRCQSEVEVEIPYKIKDVLQCKICQRFGHLRINATDRIHASNVVMSTPLHVFNIYTFMY